MLGPDFILFTGLTQFHSATTEGDEPDVRDVFSSFANDEPIQNVQR